MAHGRWVEIDFGTRGNRGVLTGAIVVFPSFWHHAGKRGQVGDIASVRKGINYYYVRVPGDPMPSVIAEDILLGFPRT